MDYCAQPEYVGNAENNGNEQMKNVVIEGNKITFSGVCKLSHKRFRALLKKIRRKLKRQAAAKLRDEEERKAQEEREKSLGYCQRQAELEREDKIKEEYEEHQRQKLHQLWLQREAEAQKEFQKKQSLLEKQKKKNENKDEMVNGEQVTDEKSVVESTQELAESSRRKKEEALKEVIASLPEGNEPCQNPIAPENYVPVERENCQFYIKTGACRFGDRCSRSHPRPASSCTLLMKGMYSHFRLDQAMHDEYDTDIGLEFEERETYQHFKEFYDDVLPEFKKYGQVIQFKVCCNYEPHLRGNVYVQYSSEEEAQAALQAFNGRFYASKQISCEFSPVIKWKAAICGLFHRNKCPKGRSCNFLHVFQNPYGEFWAADRDMTQETPRERDSRRSYRSRSHRSRSRSRSRDESEERHRKHRHSRRRSRSCSSRRSRSRSYSRASSSSSRRKRKRTTSPPLSRKSSKKSKHKKKHSSRSKRKSRKSSRSPRRRSLESSLSSTPNDSSKSRTPSIRRHRSPTPPEENLAKYKAHNSSQHIDDETYQNSHGEEKDL